MNNNRTKIGRKTRQSVIRFRYLPTTIRLHLFSHQPSWLIATRVTLIWTIPYIHGLKIGRNQIIYFLVSSSCQFIVIMEEIFQALSSSARLDKSKRPKKRKRQEEVERNSVSESNDKKQEDDADAVNSDNGQSNNGQSSRDRTGKRDLSEAKKQQIHREQIASFRRSLNIRLGNKHDPDVPDPLASFAELEPPAWWKSKDEASFRSLFKAIIRNVEAGRWKEPTPIQMQGLPTLLARRDMIGAAPTGSGKSGAFILPALLLTGATPSIFYGDDTSPKKKKKKSKKRDPSSTPSSSQGEIRGLLLAPSLELASQLHREVERLGTGKPGGLTSFLLSKANAPHAISGTLGGKAGIDILISTPLRLVDSIEKGLKLNGVRTVILDEADRLLDAADGRNHNHKQKKDKNGSESDDDDAENVAVQASGSSQTRSFLSQMDIILSEIPETAVRGLFSATVTPMVRSLSESILRNPVDVCISSGNAANPDIDQELMFVGREEGKLLAIRQLVARGQLHPPVIVFLQSQDRAQALFEELLYDKIHVDVIHAGRSRAAREKAVANFRKGDTWVLICTDLVARGVDFRAVNMVINYDLPTSGITYVHRIGRTGRAGRKGKSITLFTEADFDHLRTIANIMKQSGCKVEEWMLNLKKGKGRAPKRDRKSIDTTPSYDKNKKRKRQQMIQQSKKKAPRS